MSQLAARETVTALQRLAGCNQKSKLSKKQISTFGLEGKLEAILQTNNEICEQLKKINSRLLTLSSRI